MKAHINILKSISLRNKREIYVSFDCENFHFLFCLHTIFSGTWKQMKEAVHVCSQRRPFARTICFLYIFLFLHKLSFFFFLRQNKIRGGGGLQTMAYRICVKGGWSTWKTPSYNNEYLLFLLWCSLIPNLISSKCSSAIVVSFILLRLSHVMFVLLCWLPH